MVASVIVLAHGAEPLLEECVRALVADGAAEVVVVDNMAARGPVAAVAALPRVRILSPGRNLGYAGGCNYAAGHTSGDVLVFVNSDAVVRQGALDALVRRASVPDTGLACASIRLADDPEMLNTAGNPVHYLMFSWVGSLGEPASEHSEVTEVASITGVMFAVRRTVWEELGGFDPDYIAYCEDVYLSMRAWQAGYRVVHEPESVVLHHYEFARNSAKFYLLERNRRLVGAPLAHQGGGHQQAQLGAGGRQGGALLLEGLQQPQHLAVLSTIQRPAGLGEGILLSHAPGRGCPPPWCRCRRR